MKTVSYETNDVYKVITCNLNYTICLSFKNRGLAILYALATNKQLRIEEIAIRSAAETGPLKWENKYVGNSFMTEFPTFTHCFKKVATMSPGEWEISGYYSDVLVRFQGDSRNAKVTVVYTRTRSLDMQHFLAKIEAIASQYNIVIKSIKANNTCQNLYDGPATKGFVCSKCDYSTKDISRLTLDSNGYEQSDEYQFVFCPNCGLKVEGVVYE